MIGITVLLVFNSEKKKQIQKIIMFVIIKS